MASGPAALDAAHIASAEGVHKILAAAHTVPETPHNHLGFLADMLLVVVVAAAAAAAFGIHKPPAGVCTLGQGGSAEPRRSYAQQIDWSYRAISLLSRRGICFRMHCCRMVGDCLRRLGVDVGGRNLFWEDGEMSLEVGPGRRNQVVERHMRVGLGSSGGRMSCGKNLVVVAVEVEVGGYAVVRRTVAELARSRAKTRRMMADEDAVVA